jgi:hypothetical protein
MAMGLFEVSLRREVSGAGQDRAGPWDVNIVLRGLAVREDFDSLWHKLSEEVMSGMKEWRLQHPKATFSEIEDALDERLSKMRARMLEDLALASAAANVNEGEVQCSQCGGRLESRGKKARKLKTHHNQEITLSRAYGACPKCGASFFPPRQRVGAVER